MVLSTILVSGFELPNNLETTIRLNRTHETYTLVPESALKLGELDKPQVDDGEGNLEDLDGAYRVQMSPICVPMQAKSVVIPIYFYPKDTCYPRKETLLRIKPVWLARYPYVENYPLPVPTEITDISGLSITLTGSDDWGYKNEPCDITAEQILTANTGLADELSAAASEMIYQDDIVAGAWIVEGVHYDGLSGVCSVNIVWLPEDDKTFAKLIVSKEMVVTDNRKINLSFLKKGLVSFIGFDENAKDSVTGSFWTLGSSTSITDVGKVGKGFVLAKNGTVSLQANNGNNYGTSSENIGLHNGTIACWYNENQINLGGGGSNLLNIDFGFNRIGLVIYVFGNATSTYLFKSVINRDFNVAGRVKEINLVQSGITNNEYVHLAITWEEDRTIKMFVNGDLKETWQPTQQNWDTMISQSSDAFGITHGSYNDGGGQGLVDEVGFWDRELTEDEVSELYNAGINGKTYPWG